MKTRHITEILDNKAFAGLDEEDLRTVYIHIKECQNCRGAFEAARLSSFLLKTGAAFESPVPSAFFQAKVMNALRDKQTIAKPIEAFKRWWQAAAAPVFMMLIALGALMAFTAFVPISGANQAQAETSNFNLYSTDTVILNQKLTRDLTNEQVFEVLYETKSDIRRQK